MKISYDYSYNRTVSNAGSCKQRTIQEEILKHGVAKNNAKMFTFQEIVAATDNFNPKNRIGEGGFGNVYKGHIESINQVSPSLSNH